MHKVKRPILCDNDLEYALAEVNGKHFCVDCLLKAVQKNPVPGWVHNIKPLESSPSFSKGASGLTCLE